MATKRKTHKGLKKITTLDCRVNIVVPNVSWGMFTHECDLIKLTPAGYCSEIEIKISKADLKKDCKKPHSHKDRENKIKYLYFAIPEYLKDCIEFIPERAGILVIYEEYNEYHDKWYKFIKEERQPKQQSKYKFTEKERRKLLELMALRIWGLKKKLSKLKKNNA